MAKTKEIHDVDPRWRLARCSSKEKEPKFAKEECEITCSTCYDARRRRGVSVRIMEGALALEAANAAAKIMPFQKGEALTEEVDHFLSLIRSLPICP